MLALRRNFCYNISMIFSEIRQLDFGGTTVHIAAFDDDLQVDEVYPAQRNDYILSAADMQLRRQRYAVWRLLDVAFQSLCGKGIDCFDFERTSKGWQCSGDVHFSLSHSGNVVAAVASHTHVGVDVEQTSRFLGKAALAKRVLSPEKLCVWQQLPPQQAAKLLAEAWTQGEAQFKFGCPNPRTSTCHLRLQGQELTVSLSK